jgi:hypothetical protein
MQFVANGIDATFDLGTVISKSVFWNGALLDDADWSQVDNILTLTLFLVTGTNKTNLNNERYFSYYLQQ